MVSHKTKEFDPCLRLGVHAPSHDPLAKSESTKRRLCRERWRSSSAFRCHQVAKLGQVVEGDGVGGFQSERLQVAGLCLGKSPVHVQNGAKIHMSSSFLYQTASTLFSESSQHTQEHSHTAFLSKLFEQCFYVSHDIRLVTVISMRDYREQMF